MPAYLTALGTALPPFGFSQRDLLDFMVKAHRLSADDAHQLSVLYRASGIQKRYSVLADFGQKNEDQTFFPNNESLEPFPDTRKRMDTYFKNALSLGLQAIESGRINTEGITHLITVTCTGLQAPGLDIQLLNYLNIEQGVERYGIQFMGCYAAIPALRLAKSLCESKPDSKVLIVCLELCTLHFQREPTADNLLANCLFADGCAAAMVSANKGTEACFEIMDSFSAIIDEGKDDMAWHAGIFGFEMKLSQQIPAILQKHIVKLRGSLEAALGKEIDTNWEFAIHPGGKGIVESIGRAFELEKEKLASSLKVLRDHGNMSSPTILFVLKEFMNIGFNENKDILSLAFGPGLSFEALHLTYHA